MAGSRNAVSDSRRGNPTPVTRTTAPDSSAAVAPASSAIRAQSAMLAACNSTTLVEFIIENFALSSQESIRNHWGSHRPLEPLPGLWVRPPPQTLIRSSGAHPAGALQVNDT